MEINLNDIWLDNSEEAEVFRANLIKERKDKARMNRLSKEGYGYYLDNCGDGKWYCDHCLQEDCTKRM